MRCEGSTTWGLQRHCWFRPTPWGRAEGGGRRAENGSKGKQNGSVGMRRHCWFRPPWGRAEGGGRRAENGSKGKQNGSVGLRPHCWFRPPWGRTEGGGRRAENGSRRTKPKLVRNWVGCRIARGLAQRNVGGLVGAVESGRIGVGIGVRIRHVTGFQGGSIAVATQESWIKGLMAHEAIWEWDVFFDFRTTGYHLVPIFGSVFSGQM